MTIIASPRLSPCDESDPDDYRPRSSWAVVVDPARPQGTFAAGLTASVDVVAPGDRVPLHTHPIDEVCIVVTGKARLTVGDETTSVGPGAIAFVPAGVPHAAENHGVEPVRILGVFASERIGFTYLERNPAPGTERDPPQPPFEIDARELAGP